MVMTDIESGVRLDDAFELMRKIHHPLDFCRKAKKYINVLSFLLNVAWLVMYLRAPTAGAHGHLIMLFISLGINVYALMEDLKSLLSAAFKDREKEEDEKKDWDNALNEREDALKELKALKSRTTDIITELNLLTMAIKELSRDLRVKVEACIAKTMAILKQTKILEKAAKITYFVIVSHGIFLLAFSGMCIFMPPVMIKSVPKLKTIVMFATAVNFLNKIFSFANALLVEYFEKKLDEERKKDLARIMKTTTSLEQLENVRDIVVVLDEGIIQVMTLKELEHFRGRRDAAPEDKMAATIEDIKKKKLKDLKKLATKMKNIVDTCIANEEAEFQKVKNSYRFE